MGVGQEFEIGEKLKRTKKKPEKNKNQTAFEGVIGYWLLCFFVWGSFPRGGKGSHNPPLSIRIQFPMLVFLWAGLVTIRYFAFGSNLVPDVLQKRTLSDRPLKKPTPVVVPNYSLEFNLGTAASLEREEGTRNPAEGVVWELNPKQFALLGMTEGVPLAYRYIFVDCVPLATESKTSMRAITLSTGRGKARKRTTKRYWDLLMKGADMFALNGLKATLNKTEII